jgi:predicted metal-binding membrane protein
VASAALDGVLRRDRAIVAIALAMLTGLACGYVWWLKADMDGMAGMDMTGVRMIPAGIGIMAPAAAPWHGFEFVLVFAMWLTMMIGMMTPSATPMILIYARVARQAVAQGKPFAAAAWFVAGYLAAWAGFSLVATAAQWALDRVALLDPMMIGASSVFGAIVLIAAGVYQWTPLKDTCLRQCQAPLIFIQRHGGFRNDASSALLLGLRHGAYCVGCCWTLMALLFVGGVMNVLWIAAIAILVLAEKVMPGGRNISRVAGIGLIVGGCLLLRSAT